ncbi:MAG: CpsB/CapC family capsule biosynthesis tyrosine phosphatase [Bacteroidales bacterium]|jgi:tyrosine-protein phosphatase YwqE
MGLFNKTKISYSDFSSIRTDLHSHLLPGLDDGSSSMAESIKMIRELIRIGYTRVIATPHVISALYPNSKEKILGQLYHMQDVINKEGIQVEVEASAEYHLDDEFLAKVESGEVLPFGKENYLLVEFPFYKPSFSPDIILSRTIQAGYRPVIAHPERYGWMMGKMKLYEGLKDQGVLFQLNLNSLSGMYGFPVKMMANKLVDAGMVDFAGTDAHYLGHLLELRKLLPNKYFVKLVESGRLMNTTI